MSTDTGLLLDLNRSLGEVKAQIGQMLSSLGHVIERQKEISGDVHEIHERLAAGSVRHAEFANNLADIESKVDDIAPKVEKMREDLSPIAKQVGELVPDVKILMDWKAKVAAQTVVASAIVGSALWVIWEGLKWIFPHPKELFDKLFH